MCWGLPTSSHNRVHCYGHCYMTNDRWNTTVGTSLNTLKEPTSEAHGMPMANRKVQDHPATQRCRCLYALIRGTHLLPNCAAPDRANDYPN
jgi:hypothetical protein